ncbi:Exodeoxyribonuclease V alpha chain [Raoultella planticola]|uniref:Exodeoxyribonuclease V alpha chain n=1 Tax=Raoultella planticola TaxID=575 RepID=A0A485BQT7_RAOPL|nr:Exodeoxyribonuclease V alpha chain [Raoultella planticola]
MTMDELLLEAASQRLLRPLDVQFALMVAQEAHPAVKLAAAVLSRDAGEGHVCLPISRLRTDEFLSGKTNELREQLLAQAGVPDDWSALLLASESRQRRRTSDADRPVRRPTLSQPDVA